MSPSMPSGGTFDAGRLGARLRPLPGPRPLPHLRRGDGAAPLRRRPLIHPLHFEGMAERTIVVGSLSKEHRMIGWRVGWVAGPAETIEDAGWAHVYNTTIPVGLARAAAAAVLRGQQDHVAECVAELERRRDVMLDGLPDWPFVRPGGGWSLLLDVSDLGFTPARRRGSCSRRARSPRRRWSAGAAPWPTATFASCSALSRSTGSRPSPTARGRHAGRSRRRAELDRARAAAPSSTSSAARASPSCTRISAARSTRRSCGRSPTSRESRCRSRTTGTSSSSSPSTRAASRGCPSSTRSTSGPS